MSKRITNVKKGGAKKTLGWIAIVLALVIVVGVVCVYNYVDSGAMERKQVAMKSENFEITSAMMNYYFNTLYQNYSQTLSSMGLDTTKPLDEQYYIKGETTWYDYFMDLAKNNVRQLLVMAEAAKADGFTLDKAEKTDDHDHSADATLEQMAMFAKSYNVTLDYYIEATYGKGVNEDVFRKCYELSEIASHYAEKMTDGYSFEKADWDKYYSENKDEFNKVDYLTYTFKVEKETVKSDATDDEKASAEAKDKKEAKRLEGLANELSAVKNAKDFKAYVENYLKNDLHKGKTDEELEKEKVDIKEAIEDCLVEGATNSSETKLNKWLFDKERKANDTFVEKSSDGYSFSVYMILAAPEGSDLDLACAYRDTYKLKDFRFIPFLNSDYKDNAEDAKDAADKVLAEYKDNATEENFIKLADPEKGYGNENYEGGLVEGVDKGGIGDEVDTWLYDSARKKGDCEVIQVPDKGSYLIYYLGDGDVKWQNQADTSLKNDKYDEDYKALEAKYTVKTLSKGLSLVQEIYLGAANDATTTANTVKVTAADK